MASVRRAAFPANTKFPFDPRYEATDSSARLPSLVGTRLTKSDLRTLEVRWIDQATAEGALLRRVDSLTGAELIGRNGGDYAGIAIPYFVLGSVHVREYRLRRDRPDFETDASGHLKPRQKYLSPPGRGNMFYLVPGTSTEELVDVSLPIVLTEGEFKTLALSRLARWESPSEPRFWPVGISGIYNWRGTIGRTRGADGERIDIKGPIPDLDWIAWKGRRILIAFDADVGQKDQVRFACAELARHLRGRGAWVGFLGWEIDEGKGIDDHLAAGTFPLRASSSHSALRQ